ncbi:spore germination protein [Paenibacillus sp. HJGM_3]|uniref:spore germination protein n=1 Tax=Paenibacillus sp. HJGM_3 TaxID=3379816 RepID=UPI00385FA41C
MMSKFFKTYRNLFNRKRNRAEEPQSTPLQEQLERSIAANFLKLQTAFGNSKDLVTRPIILDSEGASRLGFVYLEGLASASLQQKVQEALLFKSEEIASSIAAGEETGTIIRHILTTADAAIAHSFLDIIKAILSGETVLLLEGYRQGIAVRTAAGNSRAVEEPISQSVVKGPREGFTENMGTNIALIRKRIKSPELWLENMTIGKVTQTSVSLMYINGIANDTIVAEARERLRRIEIDGVLESGVIEELIQDETFTPFPTVYNSERPDVIAAGLLEGRAAILVDGTPFAMLVPALFVQFYQSAEDYYQRAEFATLIRLLRYICFFISLLAPSLYIAITTFHQELLPSTLLISLAAQREGIPFPAFVEAMLMEITFEILREAGVRLPKTVGQAVSIVGALVIGQAAVEAGLVSPGMVIVVATTAISNFVIPSFNMGISIRIIRFALMIFAATFGLFGITVGMIGVVQHLCSLRSFGVPYMSPLAPFDVADQKDTILRLPHWALFSRPRFISSNNKIRENNAPTSKPKPN